VVGVENDPTTLQSDASDTQPPTAPGPNDLSANPDDGPAQPLLKSYPVTEKLGRKRSFRSDWYKLHPWMEYSQQVDAVFSYACRHFPPCGKEAEPVFTATGFRNWKKANYTDVGFSVHAKGDFHKTAMMAYGLLVPKTFRSLYAVDVSFLGRFAPWTFRSLDVSFHGPATL